MAEWQPIKTAPTDGVPVLLFTKSHGVVEAWFDAAKIENHYEYGPQYDGPVWVCADDAFQIEVEDCGEHGLHHGTATHWMPLPEPPEPKDTPNG